MIEANGILRKSIFSIYILLSQFGQRDILKGILLLSIYFTYRSDQAAILDNKSGGCLGRAKKKVPEEKIDLVTIEVGEG